MANKKKYDDIIKEIEYIILNSKVWSDWESSEAIIQTLFKNGLSISDELYEELEQDEVEIFELYTEAKNEVCDKFKYKIIFDTNEDYCERDVHFSNNKKVLIDTIFDYYCQSNESLTKKRIAEMISE